MVLNRNSIQAKVIEGQQLKLMPRTNGSMSVASRRGEPWCYNDNLLSTHVLALGSIGSGKTNILYFMIENLIANLTYRDCVIFFDSKGDFLRRFYRENDVVIGNGDQLSGCNLSYWNIYNELANFDITTREDALREISTALFKKQIDSSNNPAFPSGARDIFAAVVESQFRSGNRNMNNATLKDYFKKLDVKILKEIMGTYSDMSWINTYIHNESSATTQSYLSPLGTVVNEVFSGHFATAGNFSIREAIQKRGGRSIFLEYDIVNSNLLDAVYSVIIDLAIKETLRNEARDSYVYFVLDEFPLIPKLNYIDNLLNFGRSRGARVIAGIQNVNQVRSCYGDTLAASVLSGFSTYLAFRLFDEESRRCVIDRHGQNRRIVNIPFSDALRSGSEELEKGFVIEDWDITTLDVGECIVSLPSNDPYLFSPDLYPEPTEKITIKSNTNKIKIK